MLGGVDKFDPVTSRSQAEHSEEAVSELVVAGRDGPVDFEVTEHALDAVAFSVEALAVADRLNSI